LDAGTSGRNLYAGKGPPLNILPAEDQGGEGVSGSGEDVADGGDNDRAGGEVNVRERDGSGHVREACETVPGGFIWGGGLVRHPTSPPSRSPLPFPGTRWRADAPEQHEAVSVRWVLWKLHGPGTAVGLWPCDHPNAFLTNPVRGGHSSQQQQGPPLQHLLAH